MTAIVPSNDTPVTVDGQIIGRVSFHWDAFRNAPAYEACVCGPEGEKCLCGDYKAGPLAFPTEDAAKAAIKAAHEKAGA
ncbi:hypothetical protein [Kutzneria albida]|uniref:Uncharacterized protein n=1 Tax=Kutzneria albida DSM 43870 TaxID=1449976 RepID=W5WAT5_9PSEU|nr:hypothetical protein [Kutzneria albida]AHH98238.1 hypothetical protein KALB_4876 [Kutzneria albida DSM 43870]